MNDKFYVSNGDFKVLVTAENPMAAICEALSYMGFINRHDIPIHIFNYDLFNVHPLEFRKSIEELEDEEDKTGIFDAELLNDELGVEIEYDEAMDAFDEACRKFDPFCENDNHRASDKFYENLGDEE